MVFAKVSNGAVVRSLVHAFPGGEIFEPLQMQASRDGISLLGIFRSRSLISRLRLGKEAIAQLSGEPVTLGFSAERWSRALGSIPLQESGDHGGAEVELAIEEKEIGVLVRLGHAEIRHAIRAEEPGVTDFPKHMPDPKNLPSVFGIEGLTLYEAVKPFGDDKSLEAITVDLQKERLALTPWPDAKSMSYVDKRIKAAKPGKTQLLASHLREAARFGYGMRGIQRVSLDLATVESGLLMVRYNFEGGTLTHWIVPHAEPR